MDVGDLSCRSGELESAVFINPQPGGGTTLRDSWEVAGSKRRKILQVGVPFRMIMSSTGRGDLLKRESFCKATTAQILFQ